MPADLCSQDLKSPVVARPAPLLTADLAMPFRARGPFVADSLHSLRATPLVWLRFAKTPFWPCATAKFCSNAMYMAASWEFVAGV